MQTPKSKSRLFETRIKDMLASDKTLASTKQKQQREYYKRDKVNKTEKRLNYSSNFGRSKSPGDFGVVS